MGGTYFGVQTVRQRWVNLLGACNYTSKSPEQIRHAERKGLLKPRVAKDGTKSYLIDDLDEFMGISQAPGVQNSQTIAS